MNRDLFTLWRSLSKEDFRKAQLFDQLVKDNEPLVRKCAGEFILGTRYHVDSIREDILQAARIGLIRAIHKWEPVRGAFSTIAYHWMRHEMQQVTRHATPITRPKDADLPRTKQDAAAAFYAQHGRDPTPAEIGVTAQAMRQAQAAAATFVGEAFANEIPAAEVPPTPEADIDRARDVEALKGFIRKLSPTDRKEFWAGKREDLIEKARLYVSQRRKVKSA